MNSFPSTQVKTFLLFFLIANLSKFAIILNFKVNIKHALTILINYLQTEIFQTTLRITVYQTYKP